LIVDINMPKMDGLTFLKSLRRQSMPLAASPAIVISTEAAPQDFEAARRAGANFYLVKPLAQDTLTRYVGLCCGIAS
jgi:two-component system chemotaxis response regulator CheY